MFSRNTFFIRCQTAPTPARISRFNAGASDKKFEVRTSNPDEFVEVSNVLYTVRLYADGRIEQRLNDRNVQVTNPKWQATS